MTHRKYVVGKEWFCKHCLGFRRSNVCLVCGRRSPHYKKYKLISGIPVCEQIDMGDNDKECVDCGEPILGPLHRRCVDCQDARIRLKYPLITPWKDKTPYEKELYRENAAVMEML